MRELLVYGGVRLFDKERRVVVAGFTKLSIRILAEASQYEFSRRWAETEKEYEVFTASTPGVYVFDDDNTLKRFETLAEARQYFWNK